MEQDRIEWTSYFRYRAQLRGFDLARIEEIVRYSPERYLDCATGSHVVIGRHGEQLVLVAYELEIGVLRPITAHTTARPQIEGRIKTGRLSHE